MRGNTRNFLFAVAAVALLSGGGGGALPGSIGEDAPNVSVIPKVRFWASLRKGNINVVEDMLAGGYNVNDRGMSGGYPIHQSIRANSLGLMKLLIEYKADLERRDENGFTPLILASYLGRNVMVEELLKQKVAVDAQDRFGTTAMIQAVKNNHLRIARNLLENGGDKHLADYSGRDAAFYAENARLPALRRLFSE